jgi:hypothetical protein
VAHRVSPFYARFSPVLSGSRASSVSDFREWLCSLLPPTTPVVVRPLSFSTALHQDGFSFAAQALLVDALMIPSLHSDSPDHLGPRYIAGPIEKGIHACEESRGMGQ